MKISVITPAFNCARYIRECIESVRNQGAISYEHIVIDGGSTDGTVDILKQYPHIQWISEKDRGEADALNKALARVSGDIVYWLNADDVAAESTFSLVVREMPAGVDVLYGKTLIIDEQGSTLGLRIPKAPVSVPILLRWFQHLHISQPSMFIKKQVFDAVGGFRDDLFFSIDLELWLRIAAADFHFASTDHVLSKARLIRSDAKSAAPRETQEKNWLEVSAPFLERLPRLERVNFWKDYYLFRLRDAGQGALSPSTNPDELVGFSQALFELGMANHFQTLCEQLVKVHPELPDAQMLYAESLMQLGRVSEAAPRVAQALKEEASERSRVQMGAIRSPKRATILFPHMPYPCRSGAHSRVLAYLHGLRDLGYDLTWVGMEQFSDTPWDDQSISRFEKETGVKVRVIRRSVEDDQWLSQHGLSHPDGRVNFKGFTPPNLVRQFKQICAESNPELVVVNYTLWGDVVRDPEWRQVTKVLETQDIVSINQVRRRRVERVLAELPTNTQQALVQLIDERFYDDIPVPELNAEFAQCEPFQSVIAIAPEEAVIFERGLAKVPVSYIPGGPRIPRQVSPRYDGVPLFVIGPNPFNVQGYLYLAAKVMPQLQVLVPGAVVNVIGPQSKELPEVAGLHRKGFVADIATEYMQAPCALCPLLGGTGMQMKIVEAMAHGVPVVALRHMAANSPIEHAVNGFIANNAAEFVSYTERLLKDRVLARTMGSAARETIRAHFSQEAFTQRLADALAVAQCAKTLQGI